jgi:hypothetical protein
VTGLPPSPLLSEPGIAPQQLLVSGASMDAVQNLGRRRVGAEGSCELVGCRQQEPAQASVIVGDGLPFGQRESNKVHRPPTGWHRERLVLVPGPLP